MMSHQLVKQRELFDWLHSLDLSHYFEPFLQNGYEELGICAEIGESDLEIIGVRDIHEKIELLQAIRHLRLSHFGKDSFDSVGGGGPRSSSSNGHNGNYLQFGNTHFPGTVANGLTYSPQRRFFLESSHHKQEQPTCRSQVEDFGDYQDIEDCECDCGPQQFQHQSTIFSSARRITSHQDHNGGRRNNLQDQLSSHRNQDPPGIIDKLQHPGRSTRTQLRDHHPHPIRQKRLLLPSPSSGPVFSGGVQELTQESRGGGGSSHLYGSPLPPSSLSTRKVDSEDLDSSSGIEPDLVSKSRKSYAERSGVGTSGSTNTASSSSTPDEPQDLLWWDGKKEKTKLTTGSWYRGPPTYNISTNGNATPKSKSTRNALDVLQLQTGGHLKSSGGIQSPKSSTLSRRRQGEVPTVSGLLSSIDYHQYPQGKSISRSMASNLNCREWDYEDCGGGNTYEEISPARVVISGHGQGRTPTHHQYLEHVIVSNNNRIPPVLPPLAFGHSEPSTTTMTSKTLSPTKSRQIYTPGIYSPSSCLLDRDDIYEHVPPIIRNRHYNSSPAKSRCSSPLRSKVKSKSKSSLSCVNNRGIEGGGPGTPEHFATIRTTPAGPCALYRSSTHLTSNSSPTYVNVRLGGKQDSDKEGRGGVNGAKLLSSPSSPSSQNSSSSNGCRTMANLSKLSRRLGLGRLWRSLRIQTSPSMMDMGRTPVITKPRNPTSGQRRQSPMDGDQEGPNSHPNLWTSRDPQENLGMPTMSSLPSNERIIETINRLKYEELQKRKERIAQEHQMILKELKSSLSSGSSSSTSQQQTTIGGPRSAGSSSVFYVSATVESSSTPEEEEDGGQDQQIPLLVRSGERSSGSSRSQDSHHSSKPSTSALQDSSGMGGNQSAMAENTSLLLPPEDRLGTTGSWRELGSSRESWNNEKSSSSRTSSSSNYHSEGMAPENSQEQDQRTGLNSSPLASPGRKGSGGRSSNPMKTRKKNKSLGDGSGRLDEDSILSVAEELEQPIGNGGNSPAKALLSKVKELGSRNHKKLRRFSFSTKPTQSDHLDGGNRRGSDVVVSSSSKTTSPAIDILGVHVPERNSSEEELSSLANQGRSLSICESEEYNGPFVGKAVALVDCISSPYDLHALSYKKGDILMIIEKKPTGSWKGKLNNKIGYFKFINVQVLPDDLEEEDEETLAGYPTSSLESSSAFLYSTSNGSGSHHGRRRMKATSPSTPLTQWEMETRQTVANVINGIRKENAALLQLSRKIPNHHPASRTSTTGEEEENSDHSDIFQHQSQSGSYHQRKSKSSGRRKSSSTSLKKERPRSVGDLLRRINLEEHIPLFILHGFESLDLFKELEEEDLDRLEILEPSDRGKIMTAVELLRDYDVGEEIPPIIIPTYSCPNPPVNNPEDEDPLNQILEPPPNFTRGSHGTVVRDSGVFLKCDDKEEEDPEVDEIILSPANLPTMTSLNPSDKFLLTTHLHNRNRKQQPGGTGNESSMAQFSSLEDHYGEVRQRFLNAKSLFEATTANGSCGNGNASQQSGKPPSSSEYKNQFHYCEKSSDSGISLGANSPPPNTFE